jgi:uncharacterized protein YgbK (DUF1537 family)
MTESEAAAQMRQLGRLITNALVFKKTDSALRGHVITELEALTQTMGCQRAIYMPANPSKGRIIKDGSYYINGVPLHKTEFSFDPEFPAKTSELSKRFPDAMAHNILMPDAVSQDDILRLVSIYQNETTLFAGAADLFKAFLPPVQCLKDTSIQIKPGERILILCGSTLSQPLNLSFATAPIPREVYDGSNSLNTWNTEAYHTLGSLILTIPYTHRTGKEVAVHLRIAMAEMTKQLVGQHRPDQLIIEGGATAWATLKALGWTEFDIVRQAAPGVVQMRAVNGTLVTLKPGSYPWGGVFEKVKR